MSIDIEKLFDYLNRSDDDTRKMIKNWFEETKINAINKYKIQMHHFLWFYAIAMTIFVVGVSLFFGSLGRFPSMFWKLYGAFIALVLVIIYRWMKSSISLEFELYKSHLEDLMPESTLLLVQYVRHNSFYINKNDLMTTCGYSNFEWEKLFSNDKFMAMLKPIDNENFALTDYGIEAINMLTGNFEHRKYTSSITF